MKPYANRNSASRAFTGCLVFAFAVLAVVSAHGDTFTWLKARAVRSFGDPRYWTLGDDDGVSENAEGKIPGPEDDINYGIGAVYRKYFWDLDGKSYSVGGIVMGVGASLYEHEMSVENGTLEFVQSFSNVQYSVTVKDTGKLVIGEKAVSLLGDGGLGLNSYVVQSGGELDIGGTIVCGRFTVSVEEGGRFTFRPSGLDYLSSAQDMALSGISNSGTTDIPGGIVLGGTGHVKFPSFTVRQDAGVMTVGGPFVRNGGPGTLNFALGGGMFVAESDVSFTGLASVSMDADASAGISVAEGKTLDLSVMEFGANTVLEKTGAGTVVFGESVPSGLDVKAGTVRLVSGVDLGSGLSLSDACCLDIASRGVSADAIEGIENATVTVNADMFGPTHGVPFFISSNPGLLELVAEKVVAPSGWTVGIVGDMAVLLNQSDDRASFSSTGEMSLASADGWSGGMPSDAAEVVVIGTNTVAVLDADAPAFSSISVMGGATLKIVGTVESVPPVSLDYRARILFAEGSRAPLPAITGKVAGSELPVVEIAAGAVVTAETSYAFKNVLLKLYGEIDVGDSIWFGTADAGETAWFGLDMDGGVAKTAAQKGVFRFMCPESGGTVVAPQTLVMRNSSLTSSYKTPRFLIHVGYENPVSSEFTLQVDGCDLDIRASDTLHIGGGATVSCINGGGIAKNPANASPGVYTCIYVEDRARLVFDGMSRLVYTHSRYPIRFNPDEDGYEQLVFRNGSYMAVHDPDGNGKAVARFEDSWVEVIQLCKLDPVSFSEITDGRQWMTNAFHGLKSVNVPAGRFVGFRSSDIWPWGDDWEREILVDPDVPITGGGSLVVTNAAPGYSMRAVVACGSNTATGEARAFPSEDGCTLLFSDGANWAGTVVGDENVALTNRADGSLPATVAFGSIRLDGMMPLRVWKTSGSSTNDMIHIGSSISGEGAFQPVFMEGAVAPGDSYVIGSVPVSFAVADAREFTARGWKLYTEASDSEDRLLLRMKYEPVGTVVIVR